MLSSESLPSEVQKALRKGRAIPMLFDYRPGDIPDHTLTVVGLIDTLSFEGVFIPDDFDGSELVKVSLPEKAFPLAKIRADGADAIAIHRLWSVWNGYVCSEYLDLVKAVVLATSLDRLQQLLLTAESVKVVMEKSPEPDAPVKGRPTKERAKPRKRSTRGKGAKAN